MLAATKRLRKEAICKCTWESTQVKDHLHVLYVPANSERKELWQIIWELILERSKQILIHKVGPTRAMAVTDISQGPALLRRIKRRDVSKLRWDLKLLFPKIRDISKNENLQGSGQIFGLTRISVFSHLNSRIQVKWGRPSNLIILNLFKNVLKLLLKRWNQTKIFSKLIWFQIHQTARLVLHHHKTNFKMLSRKSQIDNWRNNEIEVNSNIWPGTSTTDYRNIHIPQITKPR